MHPGNAGLTEDLGGFPAMVAGGAAEDNGFVEAADPVDAAFQPIDGDIQGTGDMSLVIFVGGAKVDNSGSFPNYRLQAAVAKSEKIG
jgi:hypothetical protein